MRTTALPPTAALTRYSARLSDHAASHVSGAFLFGRLGSAFKGRVRKLVSPTLWAYLEGETAYHVAAGRVLTSVELEELILAAGERPIDWTPDRQLYLDSTLLVPVITTAIARETADDWAGFCRRAARQLEQPGLFATEGIPLIAEWVERVEVLIAASAASVDLAPASSRAVAAAARPAEPREHYSVTEFAAAVDRAVFTVQQWCRTGRIRATKMHSGRGKHLGWVISSAELARFRAEGLHPVQDR